MTLKPLIDHFGFLAPIYERFIPPGNPERLISLVDMPAGGVILDAAGGTGRTAQFFRDKAAHVVVADITSKMLHEVQKKEGLEPVRSYVERMPFENGIFDRIIMVDAFHHVLNQADTAHEVWRILKPGGWIVIEEPDIRSFVVKLIAIIEKLALMRSHFLSPNQIANLFCFQNARMQIETDNSTAWIVVLKIK